jgi:hypothetical protein
MVVLTTAGMRAMFDAWIAGGLTGCSLRLYKNDYTPTRTSVFADFVEADYDGYNRLVASTRFFAADPQPDGVQPYLASDGYKPITNTVDQILYGSYIVDTVHGNAIVCATRFADPFPVPVGANNYFVDAYGIGLQNLEV